MLSGSSLKFVPADTRSPVNDVSLWDHLKLTAAFSTCIYLDGDLEASSLKIIDLHSSAETLIEYPIS